jgi:hypothetical protein
MALGHSRFTSSIILIHVLESFLWYAECAFFPHKLRFPRRHIRSARCFRVVLGDDLAVGGARLLKRIGCITGLKITPDVCHLCRYFKVLVSLPSNSDVLKNRQEEAVSPRQLICQHEWSAVISEMGVDLVQDLHQLSRVVARIFEELTKFHI